MLTAFLTRADVARHLQALHLLGELRAGFATRATGPWGPGDPHQGTEVRHGALAGVPAYSVTVRTDQRAVLQLHEAGTGKLLALMDAGHLTTLTASLVGALAADVLARPSACDVAVLGAGAQASGALKALRLVRSLERVWLYAPDAAASFELALRLQASLSMSVRAVDSAAEAAARADVVVLTGEVPLPVDTLRHGTHVTVMRAERFLAAPLPASALARAVRVGDQAAPPGSWALPLHAELGDVLAGRAPGRTRADQLTLFASTAPAFLDLLAAWHVYQGARHDEGLTRLDLEA
jgi:ornithine cyclodeaminase